MNGSQMNGHTPQLNGHAPQMNGHAPAPAAQSGDNPNHALENSHLSTDILELVLENLLTAVRSALLYMEGPLKKTLEARLHDQGKLPDARCSSLAAEVVDELYRAQLILEPKGAILADHFLGMTHRISPIGFLVSIPPSCPWANDAKAMLAPNASTLPSKEGSRTSWLKDLRHSSS